MKGISCCFLLVVLNLVSCQNQDTTRSPDLVPTSTRDPYANVLSQLSDAIFDVEDRLYRLTSPKQESDNLKEPSDKPLDNRRKNYFDQIRDNYKTLQDQLGQSLSSGGIIKMADVLNLNFQNKGSRSSLDLSLPFLPLSIKVDSKRPPLKEAPEKLSKDQHSQLSKANSNVKVELGGIFGQQTPRKPLEEQSDIHPELQKRSSRPIRSALESNKKDNKKKSSSESHDDYSKHSVDDETSGVEGRILGDLLYSESTYDKYFKKALNDHGKWLLDSAISPPKKIIESIRDVTRNQFSSAGSKKGASSKGYSGMKASGSKKESHHHGHHQAGSWKHDTRMVLAFTPEGLPLKLKIDRSIHNPLKFLHRLLSEERVYLNIPVSTTNGVKYVGNDVLQLGFDDGVMSSKTPVIDMSDKEQLNYLLRTLKNLRYENH